MRSLILVGRDSTTRKLVNGRPGFTLIELLIVIAIIAILALIAIPNFLEAQTRSKTSRSKADIRSMKIGIEAYFVDWNDYPVDNDPRYTPIAFDAGSFVCLTTPVAFLTSIPASPFNEQWQLNKYKVYEYWRGGWSGTKQNLDAGSDQYLIYYRLTSYGPDNTSQYHASGYSCYPDKIGANDPSFINGLYDPTNGTISVGDLCVSNQKFHN